MVNKRKFPFMKNVNKRKRKLPVRYVRPYERTKPKMEAIYAITQHYNTKVYPKQIQDLSKQTNETIKEFPEPGPLHDPSQYTDSYLYHNKIYAERENFDMNLTNMYSKPGWYVPMPGNPNSIGWDDNTWWIRYNNAVSRDFGAHLKMRDMKKGYDRLDYARKYASNSNF
jgi:hypothetical protein